MRDHRGLEPQGDCDARDSDEVMAARVAELRERVHLGLETHDAPSFARARARPRAGDAKFCAPGGREPEVVRRDAEAMFGHERDEPVVRLAARGACVSIVRGEGGGRATHCSSNASSGLSGIGVRRDRQLG